MDNDNVFRDNLSNEEYNPTNTDLLRELQRQTKLLDTINTAVDNIAHSGQGFRYRYEDDIRDAAYESSRSTARTRTSASSARNRSTTTSRNNRGFGDSTDKDIDAIKKSIEKLKKSLGDAVDSFEDGFKGDLFGASMGDIMHAHLKKLAESLGAEVDDLPKMFGEQLGKSLNKYIRESDSAAAKYARETISNYNKMKVNMSENMSDMIGNIAKRLFPDADINMGSIKDVEDILNEEKAKRDAEKNGTAEEDFEENKENGFASSKFKDSFNRPIEFYVEHAVINVSDIEEEQTYMPGKGMYSGEESEFQPPAVIEENTALAERNFQAPTASNNLFGGMFDDILGGLKGSIGEFGGFVKGIGGMLSSGGMEAASAIGGMAMSAMSMIGPLAILAPIIQGVSKDFQELSSAVKGFFEHLRSARKRYDEETQQEISNATKRLMDDVETIVREPFEILEDAANKVYEVWDNELRIINGTQGYTKSDLQDLMSNYAARLEAEGLTSVVSSADMTENLAKVLQSGLSGAAAEEFAYIATILNAAIPTQDFFDYADTYVALAGNMIAQGYSESAALEYANEQLEIFASNTLYASRQLAGGFTTGLSEASDIFAQSVKIVQTAGYGDVGEISSVLTAVAAVTGSIAPDLATDMTDLIVQAATGGNSSELVALRSLAGINASNTEFLNQLINDPQSVFVTMFTNLDKLINTSNDAYMEVAESLSNIFGISMDALRRIDFNYLADAIASMDVNNSSLEENLALLASGQTTTSKEQLRMQQINQYMIEEGLAYVLDNEAARAVQQHMWEEQIADELMQAQYGVQFVGESQEDIQTIKRSVANLVTLNGSIGGRIKQRRNRVQAKKENEAEIEDLEAILEAGKVGTGNAQDLYNLTTRNVKLDLTPDLLTLLTGQQSAYSQITTQGNTGWWRQFFGTGSKLQNADVVTSESDASANTGYRSISSMYTWNTNIGKSTAANAGMLSNGSPTGSVVQGISLASATAETSKRLASRVEQMLDEDYIMSIVEEGGSYEDWASTARKFGISDLDTTLTDLGYSISDVQDYFQDIQTEYAADENRRFYEREELFMDNVEDWLEQIYTFMDEQIYQDALIAQIHDEALMDSIYQDALVDKIYDEALLTDIYKTAFKEKEVHDYLKRFYDDWYDYIHEHNAYDASYTGYSNVVAVQNKEKSGSQDAIYALAEELTKNTTDLREPTMQTNALLAEILIVVNAIMQNENAETSATSLSDTLSGLALGLFSTS